MILKNKHSFIYLILCTALFALAACTSDVDIDNVGNNNSGIPAGTRLTLRATASDFNAPTPSGSDASTRTPVMEGTSTKFRPGDAIGLFCVRRPASGADYISKDIYNLKMTYTEVADGTGSWEAPTVESAPLIYTDAVTYFAYYPYTEALTAASVSNEQTIREWLKTNKPLATDMRTLAKLAANDLMTATALPSLAAADRGTLALNFKHEYALLVVKPMGKGPCIPPKGVTAYSYYSGSQSNDWGIDRNLTQPIGYESKMKINNSMACEMSDGTYRILTQATTSNSQISCEYVTYDVGMLPITAYALIPFGFKANTCYTLEVRINGVTVERAVQPGDFVYQHNGKIEIYPGDGAVDGNGKIPDYTKAVGIVVTTDPARLTDTECNAKDWNHAYVMGLEDIPEKQWAASYDLPATSVINASDAKNDMNGYKMTQTMLTKTPLSYYPVFQTIKEYRDSHSVPSNINRSPWFMPSAGQWFDVMENLGEGAAWKMESDYWGNNDDASGIFSRINNQLAKVSSNSLPFKKDGIGCFWSTSEAYANNTDSNVWCVMTICHGNIVSGLLILAQSKSGSEPVRLFFAF